MAKFEFGFDLRLKTLYPMVTRTETVTQTPAGETVPVNLSLEQTVAQETPTPGLGLRLSSGDPTDVFLITVDGGLSRGTLNTHSKSKYSLLHASGAVGYQRFFPKDDRQWSGAVTLGYALNDIGVETKTKTETSVDKKTTQGLLLQLEMTGRLYPNVEAFMGGGFFIPNFADFSKREPMVFLGVRYVYGMED